MKNSNLYQKFYFAFLSELNKDKDKVMKMSCFTRHKKRIEGNLDGIKTIKKHAA